MKICYLANSRFPSERAHMTQIVHMCNAFAGLGHEVTLLVTNRKTDISEDPQTFFGVPILFHVQRVIVPDIAGNAHRIPIVLRPILFSFQRLVYAYRVKTFLSKRNFEYVYGRDEWILWVLKKYVASQIVWESHEARYSFAARKLMHAIPLVVISEGIQDFYVQKGVHTKNICVAHDAIDDRFFAPHISKHEAQKKLGINSKKPIVMYIGGLEEWKGVRTLLEASKNQDTFDTFIVGGKEKELEIMRLKYPWVHFVGSRPYRELPDVQQAADILIIPNTATSSVSALYTSPLKLFSYMTSHKSIIASRIPSITNVLPDDAAYFFKADDSTELQKKIKYVITDTIESKLKSERAYTMSLTCTWYNRAKNILIFLNERYG